MMLKGKRSIALVMAFVMAAGTLGGCGSSAVEEGGNVPGQTENTVSDETVSEEQTDKQEQIAETDPEGVKSPALFLDEALTAGSKEALQKIGITPGVELYTVEPDLSNIDNLWQFYLNDDQKDLLAQNGFMVCGDAGNEFFSIYEDNRYLDMASFVTVDSLMHTYHLYFSCLLKKVEKKYLSDKIGQLSERMLDHSIAAYERLKGSEWESAAKRNVAFYTVGAMLLEDETKVPDYVKDIVSYELEQIHEAADIFQSELTGEMEDYTQYTPRGYYEGDEELERYFQAMMWYGRIHFKQEEEDLDRSALLIAKTLSEDEEAYRLWESVYSVTSFFTGTSDDAGVCEYMPVIEETYGKNVSIDSLIGNQEAFERFHAMTAELQIPQINSIPIGDGQDNVIPGFRFMGQRFTIDGAIMQKLIYSAVKENSAGDKRMFPDVLDVPAALGSDIALHILEENGVADYKGYSDYMELLRERLGEENDDLWSESLYAGWLNTLRPLLDVKGEGFPAFMQGEEWAKKNLECFAGSFTELKHDTILYTKQVMAEMGGGYEEEPDDRGYVEPEPVVYARFAELSERTAQGLKQYGMLDDNEEENLSRLSEMAGRLFEISKKELEDKEPTEEEFEFIRSYGGNIEHFWLEASKDEDGLIDEAAQECPAALVVDVATDPNGAVLEMATGNPSMIYVVVKAAGKLKIARGSAYSFYQFTWPMSDRLTDSKWRQMIGAEPDEEGNYQNDIPVQKPDWTESYRYKYEWEK